MSDSSTTASQPSGAPDEPSGKASGPSEASRSIGERVVKATAAIMVAHLLARAMGLVQWSFIGHYHYGAESDAFVFVFEGILWSVFLIGEESLGPAFLPVFMSAREKDSEAAAWRFTSVLLLLQTAILMAAIAALMLFPDDAVRLFSRFKSDADAGAGGISRAELSTHFLRLMAPSLLGLSIGSLTYMVLNGYKKFFWPAFADAMLKLALVAGIVIGHRMGLKADALIAGVLAAGVTKIAVHLYALRGHLSKFRFTLDLKDPHLRKFLLLVAPLLAGIVFAKMRDYFNNIYVISSLETGLLSIYSFGRKIYNAVGFLVPYPLSLALFPFLCELVDRDDRAQMGAFLTRASRIMLMIFLPVSAVIVVLSVPMAQTLYQTGGKMGAEEVALAGRVNAIYSAVLPFYALETILMQAYFSSRRVVSVTVIGIFFSALSMVVSWVGIVHYQLKGEDALMLVALGFTVSRVLKALALIAVLKMTGLPLMPLGPMISFSVRAILLTAACAGAALGTLRAVERALPDAKASAGEEAPREEEKTRAPEPSKTEPALEEKSSAKTEAPAEAKTDAAEPAKKDGGKPKKKSSTMRALLQSGPELALPGLAAGIVFLLGCKLLRFEEFDLMIEYAKQKLRNRRAKNNPPKPA
ncbi:MAG: oligosaccharide flippase family protein [Planctomycetota bacterium]|nr:oligosaccharide flippase family protein [Planctomycetota bacterium]